ncbi:hypothetical protein D3C72_2426010 [compost metagenome]
MPATSTARAQSQASMSRRRSMRSASTPAKGPTRIRGKLVATMRAPVMAAEPVVSSTHQTIASWCTRSPN